MSIRTASASIRRTICDAGEVMFRLLGIKLGRGFDRIADWFARQAQ